MQHLAHGTGGESLYPGIQDAAHFGQKILGKQHDVLPPLTQGGQRQIQHAEPVEEVAPKMSLLHLLIQHPVGRGYHPDVHLDGPSPTDSHYGALLQEPQQVDLHRQGEIPYLIEKQDAMVRHLHAADVTPTGAGEGPLLMTKEF
ncbi:hypothetical protein D3C80_947970 [compost metagenome]